MSYSIAVYGERAFKKILLPAINNADYRAVLYKDVFGLAGDLVLDMEIVNHQWNFKKNTEYVLTCNGEDYFGAELRTNDIVQLQTSQGEKLTILVYQVDTPFEVYRKYSLKNLRRVTIGKEPGNHIQYDYFGMVSKQHAVLELSDGGCRIRDLSSNGIFVNSIRVKESQVLNFGDSIHILGLQMIYLGSLLAVEQASAPVVIDDFVLKEQSGAQLEACAARYEGEAEGKKLFHRTPRNIEKIDEEPIEIEEPPAPANLRQQPLLLAIGPAFTMAIPMLLGSMLSIYSYRNGGSSSLFMYAGLVTAVASALIGALWAAMNVRHAKKEAARDEEERKSAYLAYLDKSMASVREKYEKNMLILNSRYPSTSACADYGRHSAALWNRNQHHDDFLYHRIGLGRLPFQAPIEVPREHFRVHKDELSMKPKDIKVAYETLKDIPVGVDFAEHTLIGAVGGRNKLGALNLVRTLITQIAANNCYTDVKIAVVCNQENGYEADCLECVRWLPHVWSEDKKARYFACTPEDAVDVFYEIAKVMRSREEETQAAAKKTVPKPYYILFVTDPKYLEGEMISKYVFSDEGNYGLSTVLLAENYEDLPNSCEYIIQNDQEFQGYYLVTDDISDRVPVRFDEISQAEFERFARRLSAIEVNEVEKGGEIPNSLTFFDMLGVKSLDQLDVLTRWRKNRTYDSMKALVGEKAGGVPCYLDIHEKYHGPHGLVAGTTGSGKSETLQTYILSLAINYSPDDVGFFVIDYKGGGMANLFSGLPHTIGQISNLSGNQVRRAMVSIKSENRRRQLIFNEHGVNNINNYTRLYKNNEASVPVPHLLIIIDEFAELKREEPDFMRELISVAQVGRSLGVHLILATQKPSGTVDDNIWSNAKFRLCLRVQDRQDSMDMLHKPDAAHISQAGRCYLQVGNDEVYELFQSGWSGAVYDEMEGTSRTEIARMYSSTGKAALVGNRLKIRQKEQQKRQWILSILGAVREELERSRLEADRILADPVAEYAFMGELFETLAARRVDYPYSEYNVRRMEELLGLYVQALQSGVRPGGEMAGYIISQSISQGRKIPEPREKTQLDAVVEYLAALAKENGYTNQFTLWMPVLPEELYLADLKGYRQNSFDGEAWPAQEGGWKLDAYMGLIDDPVNQAQMPLVLSLSEGGHHAVCGTVVTGKSTFLQTLVYSMSHSYSPDWVNFYLLDFSSHALGAFEELPHVGGIIYENDMDKLAKFFNMMDEIVLERKKLLQGGNYEQYVKANGVVIPAIVIVIDQFSNFREKTGGIYEDALIQLSRNGVSYGIYLVMSSAGFGMMEIPNRVGDNVRTVISLEMSDKFQYSDVLHILRVGVYPESGVKGRGLVVRDGEILEFQTALSLEGEDDYMRTEKIAEECRLMGSKWTGRRARRIPEIPENPVISQLLELESTESLLADDRHLPLGYNQENASVYSIDLSRTFCYLIQGKARSGKTNVLRVLMQMAREKGGRTAVVDFSGSLRGTAEKQGARFLGTLREVAEYWRELIPAIQVRNALHKAARAEELEEEELYQRMCREERIFLFIDDLTDFVKHVYAPEDPGEDMQGFLENITEKGRMYQLFLFAGFNQDSIAEVSGYRLFDNFTKWKTGIHLGGNVASQRLLDFEYIPFMEQSKVQKPGTGMLPAVEGEVGVRTVVIPLDRKRS